MWCNRKPSGECIYNREAGGVADDCVLFVTECVSGVEKIWKTSDTRSAAEAGEIIDAKSVTKTTATSDAKSAAEAGGTSDAKSATETAKSDDAK